MNELCETKLVTRSQALAVRVDDDLVLFDAEAGKYFATSGVGADIWELIESPRSIRAICVNLMERYDVAEETCLAEVQEFVKVLVTEGLAEYL